MPLLYHIDWLEEAKADVRRFDRPTAMHMFEGILDYARTGGGNVEPLHGEMTGSFRLPNVNAVIVGAP